MAEPPCRNAWRSPLFSGNLSPLKNARPLTGPRIPLGSRRGLLALFAPLGTLFFRR